MGFLASILLGGCALFVGFIVGYFVGKYVVVKKKAV